MTAPGSHGGLGLTPTPPRWTTLAPAVGLCGFALMGAGCPQALVQFPGADSGRSTAGEDGAEVRLVELAGWAVAGEAANEAVGGTAGLLLPGASGDWGAVLVPSPGADAGAGLVALHPLDAAGPRALRDGQVLAGTPGAGLGASVALLRSSEGAAQLAVGAPGESAVYIITAVERDPRLEVSQRLALQLGRAGSALAAADFDNDGLVDLAVGAPGDAEAPGWLGLHLGGQATLSALPDLELLGLEAGDQLGAGLAAADLTGDGVSDLLVCAPGYDAAENSVGACALLEGGAGFARPQGELRARAVGFFLGAQRGDRVGDGAAGLAVADLDGDGRAELVLGTPSSDDGAGAVAVFFGDRPPGLRTVADADAVLRGADGLGQALALLPAHEGAPGRIIASAATSGSVWLLPELARGSVDLEALGLAPFASSAPSDRLGVTLGAAWAEGGALLLLGAPGVDAAGFASGELRAAPLADLQLGR